MMLPAELTDHIFSFLRGDLSALEACSEAHPLYSRLAERYYWADIVAFATGEWAKFHEQLSNNSHILDYVLTLQIHGVSSTDPPPDLEMLSFISMIPRMANLVSLSFVGRPCPNDDFVSKLTSSLQQSAIEELSVSIFLDFPFSVLDSSKNIKKLTLSNCIALKEPMSTSSSDVSPDQSLETLIISGHHNPDVLFWSMRWVACLTSLELRDVKSHYEWTAFSELLKACSNSLRRLHLDVTGHCQSTYFCATNDDVGGHWINDDVEFPFTLSALTCLKELSISALANSDPQTVNEIQCALPAITRLIKTAPPIRLTLDYFCEVPDITSLSRLDWSLLGQLRIPCIDLHIGGGAPDHSFTHEDIVDVLAENESLMDWLMP